MSSVKMAQYGVGHGHAGGKLRSMIQNPNTEVVGVFEPTADKRAAVQGEELYQDIHWFDSEEQMLEDDSIVAIASEGHNHESLDQTEAIVRAGKHVWYDKPAGDNWPQWQRVVEDARKQNLHIQMGFMLRYNASFGRVSEWARSSMLGQIFSIRAHMSTKLTLEAMQTISVHDGGIHYDLAAHMLDQIVWILGRPNKVTTFLREDSGQLPGFPDNTLGVYEFDDAMAFIDIATLETQPMARRFEVYGLNGSAIILEPFEPGGTLRLCLDKDRDGYKRGDQIVEVAATGRQEAYEYELIHFLDVIAGRERPDRGLDHELLVQETLLRGTGKISGG
ncbi:MAG: Gfo/Idh/MocA family oxidoreductase [Candidatus Latescibacterota bacterium]|nr:Gfo/Idh/MocA family oxidoreductase [Candidatus Latescibacterota bacterium]